MKTAARRPLRFESLDRVMPDVDRLLQGYKPVGRWSLGQACKHLSQSIIGSVEGVPFKAPWLLRKTVGPYFVRRLVRNNAMPEGLSFSKASAPAPELDDRAEAEALRATIRAFSSHVGPLADHPVAGPFDHARWSAFHQVHCAHHLSFLIPDPPA